MNVEWKIEYWDDTDKQPSLEMWFDSLTKEQFCSIAKELKLLSLCGNQLRLPHSKPLGMGLFELRERAFGYRIYYGFLPNQVIMLLHAGAKKSQSKDIKIARQRLSLLKE